MRFFSQRYLGGDDLETTLVDLRQRLPEFFALACETWLAQGYVDMPPNPFVEELNDTDLELSQEDLLDVGFLHVDEDEVVHDEQVAPNQAAPVHDEHPQLLQDEAPLLPLVAVPLVEPQRDEEEGRASPAAVALSPWRQEVRGFMHENPWLSPLMVGAHDQHGFYVAGSRRRLSFD